MEGNIVGDITISIINVVKYNEWVSKRMDEKGAGKYGENGSLTWRGGGRWLFRKNAEDI